MVVGASSAAQGHKTLEHTTNMAEVRNFGCCFDNFKALKIINIVFLVFEGIIVITGLIIYIALWVRIKKYLLVSILYFHSRLRFEGFQ